MMVPDDVRADVLALCERVASGEPVAANWGMKDEMWRLVDVFADMLPVRLLEPATKKVLKRVACENIVGQPNHGVVYWESTGMSQCGYKFRFSLGGGLAVETRTGVEGPDIDYVGAQEFFHNALLTHQYVGAQEMALALGRLANVLWEQWSGPQQTKHVALQVEMITTLLDYDPVMHLARARLKGAVYGWEQLHELTLGLTKI